MSREQKELSFTIEDARKELLEVFGHTEFRGLQKPVIEDLLQNKNILLLMPTGMGKSLCYQLPARLFSKSNGLTLVVSPLIALMKDQVEALLKKGFRACFINSSIDANEKRARYRNLAERKYEIVYVTPERFRNVEFREALSKNQISLFAIDEAHCISSWGHDFRPDYSRLGDIRTELGDPLSIALTATATPEVQKDILSQLHLECDQEFAIYDAGLDRKNLAISVLDLYGLEQKVQAFVAFKHSNPGPCIVYFSLIDTLEKFSQQLSKIHIPHVTYHGQMSPRERSRNQTLFLNSDPSVFGSEIILATPAFGLGIDKENIRSIFHAEIPGSIEAYYQEIGRAGRDGHPANCYLLFDHDDLTIQMDFVKWAHPDPGFIQALYNLLERNAMRVKAEGVDYLRTQLNFYNRRDFRVETALNQLERWECISTVNTRELKTLAAPPAEFLDEAKHEIFLKNQHQKLLDILHFAELTKDCRIGQIKKYFSYPPGEACGICDLCLKVKSE